MSDSFMHYHQSALDSQIEQNETEWLFPESVEDKDYPHEEEDFEDDDDGDWEYSDILEVEKDEIDSWHVEWEKDND